MRFYKGNELTIISLLENEDEADSEEVFLKPKKVKTHDVKQIDMKTCWNTFCFFFLLFILCTQTNSSKTHLELEAVSPFILDFDSTSRKSRKKLGDVLSELGYNKIAFIHINKAAGTTVSRHLRYHVNKHRLLKQMTQRLMQHSLLEYLEMTSSFSKWEDVFSFSVIRNPYTRMVSFFHYRVEHCMIPETNRIRAKKNRGDCREEWFYEKYPNFEDITSNRTFAIEYYRNWLRIADARDPSAGFSGCAATLREDASETSWLLDSQSQLRVSSILRMDAAIPFESALKRMARICLPDMEDINVKQEKKSEHGDPFNYYRGDPGAAEIIERRMAKDFEFFGYKKKPWK